MQGHGKIVEPLTNLLKKNAFEWNEEALRAFEELKATVTTISILVMLDFTKMFMVEIDVSESSLVVVLMQKCRLISFISKTLLLRKNEKFIYEKWL